MPAHTPFDPLAHIAEELQQPYDNRRDRRRLAALDRAGLIPDPPLVPDPLVTHAELRLPPYNIKYSRKHLITLRRAGQFPEPLQISPARVAWLQSDILAWLASRPRAGPPREADAEDGKSKSPGIPVRVKHTAKRAAPRLLQEKRGRGRGRPRQVSHIEKARRAAPKAKRKG